MTLNSDRLSMERRFAEHFRPHWHQHGVLLAVSGGADSTALFRLFLGSIDDGTRSRLAVGHVDHALRGEESDGDARFVQTLAEENGLAFFKHRISPEQWAQDTSGSREAAARTIRYDFLLRTTSKLGFRYVATAHTADDQAETVLHRILRGSGLSGLAGMSRFRQLDPAVTLIRPLLDFTRHEILGYLETLGQPFRDDSSNTENEFTRNRLRNLLLPMLRDQFNPRVDEALTRLAFLAGEREIVLSELAETVLKRLILRQNEREIVFHTPALNRFEAPTLRELFLRAWKTRGWPLREMGLEQWTELVDFFQVGRGRRDFPGAVRAEHGENEFSLRRAEEDSVS